MAEVAAQAASADEWFRQVSLELVVDVMRGEKTEAEAEAVDPLRFNYLPPKDRRDLQYHGYLGAWYAAKGEREAARKHLEQAVATDRRTDLDWVLAKHQLGQLDG